MNTRSTPQAETCLIFNCAALYCCPGMIWIVRWGGGTSKVTQSDVAFTAQQQILHLQQHAASVTVLLCSLAILDPRVGHTMDRLSPFISVLCHSDWLFHKESCPSRAVHGLPHLREPGIVPCIISFSRHRLLPPPFSMRQLFPISQVKLEEGLWHHIIDMMSSPQHIYCDLDLWLPKSNQVISRG